MVGEAGVRTRAQPASSSSRIAFLRLARPTLLAERKLPDASVFPRLRQGNFHDRNHRWMMDRASRKLVGEN